MPDCFLNIIEVFLYSEPEAGFNFHMSQLLESQTMTEIVAIFTNQLGNIPGPTG